MTHPHSQRLCLPPGIRPHPAQSLQSPPAVHTAAPWQRAGAGVRWRRHGGLGAGRHRRYEAEGGWASLTIPSLPPLCACKTHPAAPSLHLPLTGPRPVHPQGDHPAPGHGERPLQHSGLGRRLCWRDPRGTGPPERPRCRGGQNGQVSTRRRRICRLCALISGWGMEGVSCQSVLSRRQ